MRGACVPPSACADVLPVSSETNCPVCVCNWCVLFACPLVCECPAVTVAADKTAGLHIHKHSRRSYISCVVRHGGHPLQKPLWFKTPGASGWFSHTERQTVLNTRTHARTQTHTHTRTHTQTNSWHTDLKLQTSTNTFRQRSLIEIALCTYSLAHQVTWKIHKENHNRTLHTHSGNRQDRQSMSELKWVCHVDGRGELVSITHSKSSDILTMREDVAATALTAFSVCACVCVWTVA